MANKKKAPVKLAGMGNSEYIAGMREIRSSNKSGTHLDGRYRRARTRSANKARSIKEF